MTDAMKEMTERVMSCPFTFPPGFVPVTKLHKLAVAAKPLAAEVTRLTKAIEDAPHSVTCAFIIGIDRQCDCWKSTLTGERETERTNNSMNQTIAINHLTPDIREVLTASLKWIRRIEDRATSLPPSFMDNIDIKPLRKEIENVLEGRMTDASCAILRQVFIDSGAPR